MAGLAAADVRVPFTVADPVGVARGQEIVTWGFPFAKGALREGASLRVVTEGGVAVATESRVLGKWPDGSVKWMLVHFPASAAAGGSARYFLTGGKAPAPAAAVRIEESARGILVDTGALRVLIPRDRLALVDEVWLKSGKRVLAGGVPLRFTGADGSVHTAGGAVEKVEVEERGALRATVRVTGWLEGPKGERFYKLDARLRFFAGKPSFRADATFLCLAGPEVHQVREIAFEMKPETGASPRFRTPLEASGALAAGETAIVYAGTDLKGEAGKTGAPARSDGRVEGWAVLSGAGGAVGVAVRDFSYLAPKGIEVAPGSMRIQLWSPRRNEIFKLGRGRARTHQILFQFTPEPEADALRAFQKPLVPLIDPEYFCQTEALGMLSPAGRPETAEYDRKTEQGFDELARQRETMPRENGLQHFGDYYHGGYGNTETRGNLEYDPAHGTYLLFARSGQRKYFDYGVACNQHFVDMDINHLTGDQLFHGYTENAERHERITTRMEFGHIFTDGPAESWYLTGDERSLEVVRTLGSRIAELMGGEGYERVRAIMAGAERNVGWPLQALCRAYEVTGDAKLLAVARQAVEYIKLYARDPMAQYGTGKWWRCWFMDGCKPFMVGALHDGLQAYYAIQPDPELIQTIKKSLDWLIDYMWRPAKAGFVYEHNAMNRPHRHDGYVLLNWLVTDAFRFGYQVTGDRRYLAVAVNAFQARTRELKFEDGKQFAIDVRTSPHTAAYFTREKIDPGKLPESPRPLEQTSAPPPLKDRPEVLLRASFEGDLSFEAPAGAGKGGSTGRIAFVEGKRGQGVAVGKGGYAWLPAPAQMLNAPGTIALWVRLNFKKQPLVPEQSAVFHVEGATPLVDGLEAATIYNELRVRMKDSIGLLDGTAEGGITQWNPGEWHHVAVTWDEKRVRLYLDGEEQIRPDEGKYPWDGVKLLPAGRQTRINLGWRFGNWYCDSTIDELAVYGRALAPAEIAANYRAAAAPDYLAVVRAYADSMIREGRDAYGSVHSPLFAAALDRRTLRLPAEPVAEIPGIRKGDRSLSGANPMHDENFYQVLYALTEATGERRYAAAADEALKWFFENAQSPATGLMAWGEHLSWDFLREGVYLGLRGEQDYHEYYRPWVLSAECLRVAREPFLRFARGVWDHQIYDQKIGTFSRHAAWSKHKPASGNREFPRHGGFYIRTWADAYESSRDPELVKAIETLTNLYWSRRHPVTEAILAESFTPELMWPHSNLSLAQDLWDSAEKMPRPLAARMRELAESVDRVFLKLPHELAAGGKGFVTTATVSKLEVRDPRGPEDRLYTKTWETGYGRATDAQVALQVLDRYKQRPLAAYRKLFLDAAERYLKSEPDTRIALYPGALSEAIATMLGAWRLTGERQYLDRADHFARQAVELFFTGSPLPRASTRHEHYEAITRGDTLAMELLDVWAARQGRALRLVWTDR